MPAAGFAPLVATCSCALRGRLPFARGSGAIAALVLLRRRVIPAMQHIAAPIQARDLAAARHFKRVHSAALTLNLLPLAARAWGVAQIRR